MKQRWAKTDGSMQETVCAENNQDYLPPEPVPGADRGQAGFLERSFNPSCHRPVKPADDKVCWWRNGADHSAFVLCNVQVVGTLPTLPVEAMVVPFMNQIDVLPLVSRQSRSLLPSPL